MQDGGVLMFEMSLLAIFGWLMLLKSSNWSCKMRVDRAPQRCSDFLAQTPEQHTPCVRSDVEI